MLSIFSILVFFSASPQLFAADNNHGHAVKKTIITEFRDNFRKCKFELTLCTAQYCPPDVVNVLSSHLFEQSFSLIKNVSRDDKKHFLKWLKACAQKDKIGAIDKIITFNSFLFSSDPLKAPYQQNDFVLICDFFMFVNEKKNRVRSADAINAILTKQYPFAPVDSMRFRTGFLWGMFSRWSYRAIIHCLRAGFIMPIVWNEYVDGVKAEPMLNFLLEERYHKKQGVDLYVKPDYDLLEQFLENGANPHCRVTWRREDGSIKFQDAFDVIKCSDHPEGEKARLTALAQKYVRSPINTTDPFYPGSRGYRADFAEYLKPY